jgi:hypothetical protein
MSSLLCCRYVLPVQGRPGSAELVSIYALARMKRADTPTFQVSSASYIALEAADACSHLISGSGRLHKLSLGLI